MRLIVEHHESTGLILGQVRCAQTGDGFASMIDRAVGDEPGWVNDLGTLEQASKLIVRCGEPIASGGELGADDAPRWLDRWSQAGWTRFDEQVAELDRMVIEAGGELMIQPSSEGMLSDAICTVAWARRIESLGCSVFLDPVGWLVGSMIRDASDHLHRLGELCAQCPKVGGVLVRSIRVDDGVVAPALLGDQGNGAIDPAVILDALGAVIESAPAVAVLDRADLDYL